MIQGFDFAWCPVAEAFMETLAVPPGDPLERGLFQRVHGLEWLGSADRFALVRAVDGFGQRVVVGVAHAAGGCEDACLCQVRAVQGTDVLGAMITVVDQACGPPVPGCPADGLVQRDQGQRPGVLARGDGPSHDPSGVRVGDERHIRERAGRES